MADISKLRMLLGALQGFRDSLPPEWRTFPAKYADEYGRIDALGRAGFETDHLVLPAGAITQREVQKNYLTRERGLLPPSIDRTVLMSAVGGAIAFIEDILGQDRKPAPASPGFGPVTITGGNVNLGTVHGDMRASIKVIEGRGQEQLARLLVEMVKMLPAASHLSLSEKDDAAQLADTLAREVAAQPAGRLSAVARAVAAALGSIVTRSSELAQLWQAIEPHLMR